MREICEQNDDYARIGAELIQAEKSLNWIRETEVSIGFMSSNKAKVSNGKTVFGQCERVPDRYKAFIPYDFLITVYEPNVIDFTSQQIRILLHHELLHCGVNMNAEPTYKVVPHDVEEFNEIIDRYGLDWSE
jgi:hypothetical protein